MLKLIAKFLKILNSETDPAQISLAFAFSLIVGLTPFFSLHNLIIIFLVSILRVNLSAFILGTTLFSGIAYILDPFFHSLGMTALNNAPLAGIWTKLYNLPVARLARFNNSVVMGSLIFSLILFIPLHIILKTIITKYRQCLLAWAQKLRIVQIIKASKLYNIYESLSG